MTSIAGSIRLAALAACASAGLLILPAPGFAAKTASLDPQDQAAVTEVANYLTQFRNIQGEFVQVSSKGNVSKGVFYLSKPGKMRFEYASPNPFIIVSDGTWVTIKNRAKDTADQYPLSQTPLRLVLDDDIDLLDEANVLDVQKSDGLVTLTIQDRKKTVPGHLILVYDETQKALQQWIVVDGKGRRTTVELQNLVSGVKADPALFTIEVKRKARIKNN
ncbi:MAG: outer membrane lipoprotein carrier protein LolA [Parvibaculaceae bacterium]